MKRLRSFSDWPIQRKFLFIFILFVLVPTLAFSLFIYSRANEAVQTQAINNTRAHLEKVNQTISAALKDIESMSTFLIYSDDVRAYLKMPDRPEYLADLRKREEQLNGYAVFHLTSKMYLHSLSLAGRHHQMHIGVHPSEFEQREAPWRQKAVERRGKGLWTDAYAVKDAWNREARVISLFRVINDINQVSRPIGVAVIRLDVRKLYEYIKTDFGDAGQMMVVDRSGTIVMHADPALIGRPFPDSRLTGLLPDDARHQVTLNYRENGIEYHVVAVPVEGTDLITVGFVNETSVARGITGIRQSIPWMMAVMILLGVVAMIGVYHVIIKRIADLIKRTHQVERGDFTAQVPVTSNDEIGLLGTRFNHMVRRLKSLIENEYQMELRNRESELKMLQSQINPHFLYNTLDMIRWTARLEKAPETSRLIELLSRMFRTSLSRGQIWIPLKDELDYCRSYLELQKRRLGGQLVYSLHCEYDVADEPILKLTIQPLIENSIHHGFAGMKSLKRIRVRCFREQDRLFIDVMDNGKGFTKEQFDAALRQGFALRNIQERLRIAYGDAARLSVEEGRPSGDGHPSGAWVRLSFPLRCRKGADPNHTSAGDIRHETERADRR